MGRNGTRRSAPAAWAALAAIWACGCDPAPRQEVYVRQPTVGERSFGVLADGSEDRPFTDLEKGVRHTLPGGSLHVGHGVYDGPITIDKDLRLEAYGRSTPVIDSREGVFALRVEGVKAVVRGLSIRRSKEAAGGARVEGVSIRGACDVTIQDVSVTGFHTGVRLELAEGGRAILQDSKVTASASYGVSAAGSGEAVFSENLVTASGVTGVTISERLRFKLLKNRISQSGNFGVEIAPAAEGEMSGNYIERSGLSGVALRTPGRVVVEKNESVENRAYGFTCLAKGDFACSGNIAERNEKGDLDEPCKEACAQ